MSNVCRVKYIDRQFSKYPDLREKLTEIYHNIWSDINASNLFRKYGEGANATFLFSSPNTELYNKQNELISSVSRKYGYPEGTSAVKAEKTKSLSNDKVLVNVHPIAQQEYDKLIGQKEFAQREREEMERGGYTEEQRGEFFQIKDIFNSISEIEKTLKPINKSADEPVVPVEPA